MIFRFGLAVIAGLICIGGVHGADSLDDRIERFLTDKRSEFGIVGYSAVVLRDGQHLYSSTAGEANLEHQVPVGPDTVFQVFSVAKLFANVTLMQLVEEGQVGLDAPVGRYLDEIPDAWRAIPVRALMSHTSGLPEYYRWPERTPASAEAALEFLRDRPLEFETGTRTRYNQTNYLLVKGVIEAVTGEGFVSVVQRRMIEPSLLEHTRYAGEFLVLPGRATMYRASAQGVRRNHFIDQPDYMFASTGLNSTARDLAHWFRRLLGGAFLSEATINRMWSPAVPGDRGGGDFALGWEYAAVDGMTVVGHGGGNRADVRHFTRQGRSVTVIFLSNGSESDFWPGSISYGIARLVLGAERVD